MSGVYPKFTLKRFSFSELAQQRPADIVSHTLYTCPADEVCIVDHFNATNVSGLASSFYLFANSSAAVYGKSQALFYDYTLGSNTTLKINNFALCMAAGGYIGCQAGDASAINFSMYGVQSPIGDRLPDVYSLLAQSRPPVAHGVLTAYQTPAGYQTIIKRFFVCNTEGSDDYFRIYLDKNGTTYSGNTALYYDAFLFKNNTYYEEVDWALDDPAGAIGVSCTNGSSVTFSFFGYITPLVS